MCCVELVCRICCRNKLRRVWKAARLSAGVRGGLAVIGAISLVGVDCPEPRLEAAN